MLIEYARIIIGELKKYIKNLVIVGSVRRDELIINDIDLLLIVNKLDIEKIDLLFDNLLNMKNKIIQIDNFYLNGNRRKSCILTYYLNDKIKGKISIDFFITLKKEKPFALFQYTGNKNYNIRIRALCKRKNLLLNQYGIFNRKTNENISKNIKTEKQLTKFIGVSYRIPSNRN